MLEKYQVFIERGVVEALQATRNPSRKSIREFLASLPDNPFEEGDFAETDSLGRETYCKVIDEYALSYYPDHAAKEVKSSSY